MEKSQAEVLWSMLYGHYINCITLIMLQKLVHTYFSSFKNPKTLSHCRFQKNL